MNWIAFQINHPAEHSTATIEHDSAKFSPMQFNRQTWLEVLSVFAIFAWLTSTITPGVNESHYLTKAKHFWNPDWCSGDIFLSSSDAHLFFFVIGGWPTLFLSLDAVAWIGRTLCWLGAAAAWVNLNRSIGVKKWFSIISGTLFVLLVERFDMAGEWVVGGFEGKSVAYIFVLWSISLFLQNRSTWFWPVIGCAIAFHAIVGIWALICFVGVYFFHAIQRQGRFPAIRSVSWSRAMAVSISSFVILVLCGILPPLISNAQVPKDVVSLANEIQVHERLGHHLLFGSFQILHVARFVFLIFVFLIIFQLRRVTSTIHSIQLFTIASLAISLTGLVLSGLAEQKQGVMYEFSNSLLRYYWFRFSDFTIPLAISCSLAYFAGSALESGIAAKKRIVYFSTACLLVAAFAGKFESFGDWRSGADRMTLPSYSNSDLRTWQTYENWKKVCHWVRMNTRSDAVFFTPYQFQTFKWYAHRNEFACWKDMPQDARSVVEWRNRIGFLQYFDRNIGGGMLGADESYIAKTIREYGITHILARQADEDLIEGNEPEYKSLILNRIYPVEPEAKTTFVVYSISAKSND